MRVYVFVIVSFVVCLLYLIASHCISLHLITSYCYAELCPVERVSWNSLYRGVKCVLNCYMCGWLDGKCKPGYRQEGTLC